MVSGKKIIFYTTLSFILLYLLFAGLAHAKPFLAPFSVAVILSLLVLPLSRKMEKGFFNRATASLVSALLLFILSLGMLALLSIQLKSLMEDWPNIKKKMQPQVEQIKSFVLEHTPVSQKDLEESSSGKSFSVLGNGSNSAKKATAILNQVFSFVGNYLLTFIYIFFMLTYRHHFRKFLLRLFPEEDAEEVNEVVFASARVTQKYLVGKLILIAFLAVLYSIGLGFSGVDNFILVSVIAAIFSIVPYVGNILGFGLALVFGYVTSGGTGMLLGITITFSIAQFVESYILEPYLVGDKVDLHPFIVILVVVVGNMVWGIIGMILAIPILAILNIIFLHVTPLKPFGFLFSKRAKG